jgi:hypothetical protein
MSEKEWHVEHRQNPFSVAAPESLWRLRDEKGWFEPWTKQEDAWTKARYLARKHRGRAFLHRKDGSVRTARSWVESTKSGNNDQT